MSFDKQKAVQAWIDSALYWQELAIKYPQYSERIEMIVADRLERARLLETMSDEEAKAMNDGFMFRLSGGVPFLSGNYYEGC